MTDSERATPGKQAARGEGTSSRLVEVYKILAKVGEPLTVRQIAERMPRTGYISAAMNAYREHKEREDPTWLEGKGSTWSNTAQDEAFIWWVRGVVKYGVRSKKITVTSKPVSAKGGGVTEGTYVPGKPPMVRVVMWREEPTLVPWSPELEEELTGTHVAGMQFLRELEDYRREGRHKVTETKALLDLAEKAIRKGGGR